MALGMTWRDDDEIWLLGAAADDAGALVASELAWRRGCRGGRASLDVGMAAGLIGLLPRLARDGVLSAAHDLSVGGLGVALARMAIASGIGAAVTLDVRLPNAALFGERAGRVVVGVPRVNVPRLHTALGEAAVDGGRLGVAGGQTLSIELRDARIEVPVERLANAWRTPF